MVKKKLNTSPTFKAKMNGMSKRAIIDFVMAGFCFFVGLVKYGEGHQEMTCINHMSSLGDIELPEEVVDKYDKECK